MSVMSEIDASLKLNWRPTWFGYEHGWSDYYIVQNDGEPCVLESKAWPHPILTGELATLVHYVDCNEGFTWSRELDIEPDDDPAFGLMKAGALTIGIGALIWLVIILGVWWAW